MPLQHVYYTFLQPLHSVNSPNGVCSHLYSAPGLQQPKKPTAARILLPEYTFIPLPPMDQDMCVCLVLGPVFSPLTSIQWPEKTFIGQSSLNRISRRAECVRCDVGRQQKKEIESGLKRYFVTNCAAARSLGWLVGWAECVAGKKEACEREIFRRQKSDHLTAGRFT